MIEDISDLKDQLESLFGEEEGDEEEGEAEEPSLKEQQLQLQEELARAMSTLEAVRMEEWVRKQNPPSAREPMKLSHRMLEDPQRRLPWRSVSGWFLCLPYVHIVWLLY